MFNLQQSNGGIKSQWVDFTSLEEYEVLEDENSKEKTKENNENLRLVENLKFKIKELEYEKNLLKNSIKEKEDEINKLKQQNENFFKENEELKLNSEQQKTKYEDLVRKFDSYLKISNNSLK